MMLVIEDVASDTGCVVAHSKEKVASVLGVV
jgi:hypothetical protein